MSLYYHRSGSIILECVSSLCGSKLIYKIREKSYWEQNFVFSFSNYISISEPAKTTVNARAMIDEKSSHSHIKKKIRNRLYEPDSLLNNLVRKRKLELDSIQQLVPEEDSRHNRLVRACENESKTTADSSLREEERTVKVYDKGFSITRAVADLIGLNGGASNVKIERDLDLHRSNGVDRSICSEERVRNKQKVHYADFISMTMPSPDISLSSNRQSFILSLPIFKQHQLIRDIREHLPHAHLVERIFNSDIALLTEQRVMAQNDVTSEADIILSPGTGLIWTSLQKIKQRSLPGQKSQSPIKERLRILSAKYEQIIFLISKNTTSNRDIEGCQLLDESDCNALADIHGFGAQLDCHLTVYYVPGQGADLIKWILAVMGKHGKHNEGSVNLLEDESLVIFFAIR